MEGVAVTIDLTILIPLVGLVMAVLALAGGVFYRLGQLNNRVSELERRFDRQTEENRLTREELRQEIRETREELHQEIRETREELRQEIRETREEFRQEMREMREENRRNHQQLLQALAHHTHDPATGAAVFSIPQGMENAAD